MRKPNDEPPLPFPDDDPNPLRDVLAHPDEDWPRLIYADRLEAGGDESRATFIRVQIALADAGKWADPQCRERHEERCVRASGLPSGGSFVDENATFERKFLACGRCRWALREALRVHERELEIEYGVGWRIGYSLSNGGVSYPPCEFHRGFIEVVTLSAANWLGGTCGNHCFESPNNPGRWVVGGNLELVKCPACDGSGRLPGHAAALRAATPLKRVRLMTTPEPIEMLRLAQTHDLHATGEMTYENRNRWYVQLLAAEFPGLEFELPADPPNDRSYSRTFRVVANSPVEAIRSSGLPAIGTHYFNDTHHDFEAMLTRLEVRPAGARNAWDVICHYETRLN